MLRIDAHQHFWKFDPIRDSWITEEMLVIRRDFGPQDLEPILKANGMDGTVVVQSDQSYEENEFHLAHAGKHDFIKGIVGWVDLQSPAVDEKLAYYSGFNKMKGFRHVLQGEADRSLMLRPAFKSGIAALKRYNFTYDILIYTDQIVFSRELVAAFPDQLFIIDHLAKPPIKDKNIIQWKKNMEAIAAYDNVYCKVSGMVTEADWKKWKKEDFVPYLDTIVNAFGTKRIVFGSDWPVCLVAASYTSMLQIVKDYFSSFTKNEQDLFFGGNASTFYHLD
jgi:L-fuconolactonase